MPYPLVQQKKEENIFTKNNSMDNGHLLHGNKPSTKTPFFYAKLFPRQNFHQQRARIRIKRKLPFWCKARKPKSKYE